MSDEEIYELVRVIPKGRVVTYGQLADLLGIRSGHRIVARAMGHCPSRLPWHRVVGKQDARRARVALGPGEHAALQRRLLEKDGVVFDARGFIPLAKYGWEP